MKFILIQKGGQLKEIDWTKNLDLQNLYKKCGFRKNNDFKKQQTWKVNSTIKYISAYAKNTGRANTENKYELPPPIDNDLYFGNIGIICHSEKEPTIETMKDINESIWKLVYEKLMGGFEDLGDEDSYSEEEYIDPANLTKEGYEKDDFVVGDSEEELVSDSDKSEKEYFSSDNEENSGDDSLEEDNEVGNALVEAPSEINELEASDIEDKEDCDSEDTDFTNTSSECDELCEEDYEY